MAFDPPPPAVAPAKPKAAPASGLPKAAPKAPAVAAAPAVPPVAPFVPPARPKVSSLLTGHKPADHFAPRDPVQRTTGVRQDPPANEQQSVPADGTLGLGPGLGWQPFGTGGY